MINSAIKPKLFLYGGCDLHDIVQNDLLKRDFDIVDYAIDQNSVDNGDLDFKNRSFPDAGTSVISLYTKPGPVAQRVLETLSTGRKRDVILNRIVYNEIVKFPYLEFYKKHAGPNDFIAISFSPELYTKFLRAGECFSCIPAMGSLRDPENCLHWLWNEYFTKEEYTLPFDTKESLEWSFDLMVDFARDIYEIFGNRVILVKTHLSNLMISTDHSIKSVKVGPDNLLFYRQSKIVTDPTDHNYAERLSTIIMNKFRHHYKADLDVIKLTEPVFVDANHRWGYSQFHIDLGSRIKIAKLIYENLVKKTLEQKIEQ